MIVAGLEVSTSAAKCILFSLREGIIRDVSIPFPLEVSDTVSQDPDGVVEIALQALTRAVRGYSGKVDAIGLGGIWHSLLALSAGRRPIGRIRTWADVNAAPTVKLLKEREGFAERFHSATGCRLHAMYPVWKWQHQTRIGTAPPAAFLSSQVEFVFETLTGQPRVSRNMASGTGFLNIRTLDWDDEILELAGLDRGQLSELAELDATAPLRKAIADKVGLPAGIPVTVGGADGALTQVGIGGCAGDAISLSVGTSGAVRRTVPRPAVEDDQGLWCYYLNNGFWLAGAATHACSNLAIILEWLQCRVDKVSQLEDEAGKLSVEDAPYFLPFLYGERCPGWAENRSGGFFGLRASHTHAHLYRAVLEGILFNLYQCFIRLDPGFGLTLRATGGILNSPVWMQMAADVFGQDLMTGKYAHDSLIGAAVMALAAVGELETPADFCPEYSKMIEANPERHEMYRSRFQRYLELYQLAGEERPN